MAAGPLIVVQDDGGAFAAGAVQPHIRLVVGGPAILPEHLHDSIQARFPHH